MRLTRCRRSEARQLTLFENGQPTLQVLTSDVTAPAAALLAWLRCRWRIENVFKYLTAHHGIDWLCHYGADTGPDTALIDNPARKAARAAAKAAQTTLADAQCAFAQLLGSQASVEEKNRAIPGPCCQIRVHAALVKILCRCVVRVLSGGFPVSQAS